ncbi:MAG: tetratricopeptide repeat protein [Candidatus Eisenbacteria bacterium]|uniref:Tetratricopeptide repeat protein n=1 Tax=Eiseniibacteriota bacterium TaxID=2212470 RepID=A0A538SAW8_UNCEI|nr:MAG: tetratricopeptide repeat protein [Candidatus Eisenbacteria bacterium]
MTSPDAKMNRSRRGLVALVALLAVARAPAAAAGRQSQAAPEAATPWKEIGDAYESSRLRAEGERLPALERLQASVAQVLRGPVDDDERAAARFLSARIHWDRGEFERAAEEFGEASRSAGKGPFADDGAFAAIEALEASGKDAEAAREWKHWLSRYPESPLVPAVHLKRAWNALRRNAPDEARDCLAQCERSAPWIARQSRFVLARATWLHYSGHEDEALALLGDRPAEIETQYLRALCLAGQGQVLKAASAFQDVAARAGDTPIADRAALAKANLFLAAGDPRSAAEEMARVAATARDPEVQAEAELRAAGAVFLAGGTDSALAQFHVLVERHDGTDVAARAQFLIGEALARQNKCEDAIVEYNRVLARYFEHRVAASAQYRVARCLDALGRRQEATGSYMAVVSGYPLAPEAPAAAYLAGLGLLDQRKPRAAAPLFQLVLDRYAKRGAQGAVVFASPEHRELVEAALCMLEYSYHLAGDPGQLAGAPHLLLQQMPPSRSPWRAYALLIDADAQAALGRYPEAQATLERLARELPDHPVSAAAQKLLAWTCAKQGRDSLAVATEERLLTLYGASGREDIVSAAVLDIAHARFNQKRYRDAAGAYEDFLRRWPTHPRRQIALYQAGLCYLRLDRAGDAVDRWEALVRDSADSPLAERAWARAGDVYFQAERYGDAQRSYRGLLEHFAQSSAAGLARLRLAQCEYNAGRDAEALKAYSAVIERSPNSVYAREAQRGTERTLYRLSQKPGGGALLARLVDQYPTSPFAADALFQIGKRCYQQKQWAEAADRLRQVVTRFPSYSAADQAQFLIADAYAQAGSRDEARQAYERFLAYFPESRLAPTVGFRLGLLRFEAKEFLPAAAAFERALADSLAPELHSAARYDLALCHRQLGDQDKARAELERYRAESPSGAQAADATFQLADLDEGAGHLEDAARGFGRTLALSPAPSLALEAAFRLGRCREQLHDGPGALKAYQVATQSAERAHPMRLSALARVAALHEARGETTLAVAAYRDIMRNAKDQELVAAAADRVSALAGSQRRR